MWISLVRTLIVYAVILAGMRLMGKRQISQLQNSELVATLLISELATFPIQEHYKPLWNGLAPIALLIVCEIAVALLMLKSGKFRQAVCGRPMLVIEDGKILQHQLRRLRMSTEDLLVQLRLNGVFSLDQVAYAIVETNGMMSVARHAKDDPLTPRQAGVKTDPELLEAAVISDGRISPHSLALCGRDEAWAREKVRAAGLSLEQVFLMTARKDGKIRIVKKED